MAFSSVYSDGGQNATYTSDNWGSGGGGGGGGSLEAQMSAMGNFDPANWINILRQDQRDLANNQMFNTIQWKARQTSAERDARNKAEMAMEKQRQRATAEAGRERLRTDADVKKAEGAGLRQFGAARSLMDRLENPLDRYTSGNSNLGSNFRNFVGASALSGVGGGFPNEWTRLYEAAGGVDPTAQSKANLMGAQAGYYNRGGR